MKKLITSMVLGAVLTTSASMSFASENEKIIKDSENNVNIVQILNETNFDYSELFNDTTCSTATSFQELPGFKEYMDSMEGLLKDIPKADFTSLEKLYNEISDLEKLEKFEESSDKWKKFDKILEKHYKENIELQEISFELPTFEEYMDSMNGILKDIPKADFTSLEKLYDEIIDLEKSEKFEETYKKWQAFDEILEKYFNENVETVNGGTIETLDTVISCGELPDFEEYMDSMKEILKDIPKTDLASLEKLYNEIAALEKEQKFKESDKKWEEFYKIVDKYLNEYTTKKAVDTIILK